MSFKGSDDTASVAFDTCTDGYKNGNEPTADCGGQCEKKCDVGDTCNEDSDCDGLPCAGGLCGAQSCKEFYDAGVKEAGFQNIVTNKKKGTTENRYCADGWDGSIGSGGEAEGWFQVDTCQQSWNAGPNQGKCEAGLQKASSRSHEKMLDFYKNNIDYPSAANFHKNGQFGAFQRWKAPRDVTVEFKLWGASGTVCYWWPSMISEIGRGGYSYGTVKVKAGDEFWFIVGQKGRPGTEKPGGWGGGGRSWTTNGVGGSSGSGATHIFWRKQGSGQPPLPTSNSNDFRILVAGGAGATSTEECGSNDNEDRHGGHGGGTTGQRGGWGNECGGGYGGTQGSGGSRGCDQGENGARFFGGRGAQNDAGAGGGGYHGGGGGGYNSGGGGGSSFLGNSNLECSGCPEPSSSGTEPGKNELPGRRENQKNPQGTDS